MTTERAPQVWVEDLEPDVCLHLLASRPVGRLAFVADGIPQIYPINHRSDGRTVVFRTSEHGSLGELVDGPVVAYEVDDADATAETGWSVLLHGRIELIADDEIPGLAALDVHPFAPDKHQWLRLRISDVSGRAISRRPVSA
jgi:nitroimidazol reductase NimA-like FMN-containing flavoprotein (pyridoxamine 5'-phosphate oxidase superfamily)